MKRVKTPSDKDRQEERMNRQYTSVLRFCTWIGLVIVLLFGSLYLAGIGPAYDVSVVMQHWDRPSTVFWQEVRGEYAEGYAWFLQSLPAMDSLSMMGILLLAATPLISLGFMILRMRGVYLLLIALLIVEYLYSILRPLL
jgi:ABC-type branched-subunit amino acid transport system permease subunit